MLKVLRVAGLALFFAVALSMSTAYASGGSDVICTNTCEHAHDGDCDDGGPGSDYDLCDYGTDCADCGERPPVENNRIICTNSCRHANDGDCDDGGPGSDYDLCDYGTDCSDCGPRPAQQESDDSGSSNSNSEMICTNTCQHANDGDCDDGGPGSDYDLCDYGTDCNDCGPRPPVENDEMICTNSCQHANDGDCDDGGPGSDYDLCEYGTDCADCGPRPPQQESSSNSGSGNNSSGMICSNTCQHANDGDCDDGGPGSDYDLCDYGTDCNDCGERPPLHNDEIICTDTCQHAKDGDCDDGGPGSDYDLCDYGTDCSDCGPRPVR